MHNEALGNAQLQEFSVTLGRHLKRAPYLILVSTLFPGLTYHINTTLS
jgi:hypothetical protein